MSNSSHPAHRIPPYRRPIIVVSFLSILAIVIVATIAIFININPAPEEPTPTPSQPIISEPTTPIQPSSEEEPAAPEDKVSQYEGEDPNQLDELTGRIAYKAVNREANLETLTVSASIDQYLHSGGTCTLSLKNANNIEVYSTSLPAQPDVTTSACGPFEVAISDFSPGAYQITIAITGDDKTGLIVDTVQL